jgi:hypothetical protein
MQMQWIPSVQIQADPGEGLVALAAALFED